MPSCSGAVLTAALIFGLIPALAARDARPSEREQAEALQEYRKLMTSTIASVRVLGVAKLKSMDFVWRVEELIKVIRQESARDKDAGAVVVQEAIDVLGNTRDREAIKLLMELIIKEKDSKIRLQLMESLGGISLRETEGAELPWDEIEKVLDAGLAGTDQEEIIASVECYTALRRSDKYELVVPHISHADWQVRSAVVAAVLSMFDKRKPRGVKELYQQLENEKGKLRTQIKDALTSMTGWDCAYDVDCWEAKWTQFKSAGSTEIPPEENEGNPNERTVAEFFKIELTSERLLFVVDVSSSMLERYNDQEGSAVYTPQDWKNNPKGLAEGSELSKWDVAREELTKAILALKEQQNFNIIFFANAPEKWQRDLVPADETNKKKAIKKVDNITISQKAMTDMYGALEAAFRMAGGGVKSEFGAIGVDTVIFFTDGMPTAGEINLQTPLLDEEGKPRKNEKNETITIPVDVCYKMILQTIRNINKFKKLTIHTIGVGDHAEVLLYGLAKDSGGVYAVVEKVMADRARQRKLLERDEAGGDE